MNKSDQAGMDRPFPGIPACERYTAIGSLEEARQRICRMLDRGEALGVVMGPPGTGKSLLCQKIASLYRHSHAIVNLGDIRVSSRLGLIQQVLFHLGKPHQGADEGSLHLALVQSLTHSVDGPRPLLLIIDEAQMLSTDLLDEIRMMTNLARQGRPMVQTLLVGGPRLEDALVDPQMESLTQRVAARCYLHPLTHGETAQYIRAAMSTMSLPVEDAAITSVHHASGGVPRLINQLMDQAIEIARARRNSCLDDACIQIAWAELQQLPSPILDAALRPQRAAVEFAELDGATFDFENESMTAEPATAMRKAAIARGIADDRGDEGVRSSYTDIATILNSASIDCLSPSLQEPPCEPCIETPQSETAAVSESLSEKGSDPLRRGQIRNENDSPPKGQTPFRIGSETVAPVELPAPMTLPLRNSGEWFTPAEDELFGADFDQEMPLELTSGSGLPDPGQGELSLHEEIRRLSAAAEAVFGDSDTPQRIAAVPGLWSTDSQSADSRRSHAPSSACDLPEELACPLAVVWSEEVVDAPPGDDRDMLVIEEDVTMIVDEPHGSFVAAGAMRKPTRDIEQNYQNLFSRLRRGQ